MHKEYTIGETVNIPSGRGILGTELLWSGIIVGIYITKTNKFYDVVRDYDSVIERVEETLVIVNN